MLERAEDRGPSSFFFPAMDDHEYPRPLNKETIAELCQSSRQAEELDGNVLAGMV